jgi:hypothetical protein
MKQVFLFLSIFSLAASLYAGDSCCSKSKADKKVKCEACETVEGKCEACKLKKAAKK